MLLRIVRDSVYADTLRIDAEGMATLPLAGDVLLAGVAGDRLQSAVRAQLTRFLDTTVVTATLLRRVRVVGEVAKPGVYFVDRTYTLRDAVATAGGVTPIAHDKQISLVRDGNSVLLRDWRLGAEGGGVVESGDELVVARLAWYKRELLAIVSGVGVLASIIIAVSR